MRKKRMRMSDGSEFTVFFLKGEESKFSDTTYILNPQLDKNLIKEIIKDGMSMHFKLNMKKANPNKMDWDL